MEETTGANTQKNELAETKRKMRAENKRRIEEEELNKRNPK